ncbi:hypothetical protein BDZ97DRAFT_1781642 [Flammula alnicola]|nr:hypothetical protein BDZ97DRAFT_1781642 [Flammula alnicola]
MIVLQRSAHRDWVKMFLSMLFGLLLGCLAPGQIGTGLRNSICSTWASTPSPSSIYNAIYEATQLSMYIGNCPKTGDSCKALGWHLYNARRRPNHITIDDITLSVSGSYLLH